MTLFVAHGFADRETTANRETTATKAYARKHIWNRIPVQALGSEYA